MAHSLILLSPDTYNEDLFRTLKGRVKGKRVLYITLTKTAASLKELLAKEGIDPSGFHFIDAITPKLFKNAYPDSCTFVDSLDDLSKVADTIITAARMRKVDLVVFDSLSSLLAYKKDKDLIEFSNYIFTFLERLRVDSILCALTIDEGRPFIEHVTMTVSQSIRAGGRR